ncbi:hypothetical protein KIH79_06840 [Bifidobacterium sp. 82T10]|uniref:Uncharacterized protein n=1 Tax=Bifidobacterium miconis TaxID=2834435 RepID=A0ABS6WFM2_9BIFI|nr:hypothetical protein [Bifidobacterium miconis]MBW3092667.1 hypothetical protein [Bifidobacterium miconis]
MNEQQKTMLDILLGAALRNGCQIQITLTPKNYYDDGETLDETPQYLNDPKANQ